ncbi:hypothetical protein VTO73DRAFT_15143 [Trametes versicolor]
MPRRDTGTQVRSTADIAATISTLFDLGDSSPKRTLTHLGDPHTPSLSPRRTKREACSSSSTLESLDSAAQRAAPTASASTRQHSATTAQHTKGAHVAPGPRTSPPISRLARYYVYFKKLFADDTDVYEGDPATRRGCRASRCLSFVQHISCVIVLRLASKRLCAIWDAEHPLKASPRPATKMSPPPSSLSADTTAVHTFHDEVPIIFFARKYGIPELLKRAFYGLLASVEFWAARTADRK